MILTTLILTTVLIDHGDIDHGNIDHVAIVHLTYRRGGCGRGTEGPLAPPPRARVCVCTYVVNIIVVNQDCGQSGLWSIAT